MLLDEYCFPFVLSLPGGIKCVCVYEVRNTIQHHPCKPYEATRTLSLRPSVRQIANRITLFHKGYDRGKAHLYEPLCNTTLALILAIGIEWHHATVTRFKK